MAHHNVKNQWTPGGETFFAFFDMPPSVDLEMLAYCKPGNVCYLSIAIFAIFTNRVEQKH